MGLPYARSRGTAKWASFGDEILAAVTGKDGQRRKDAIARISAESGKSEQYVAVIAQYATFVASVEDADPDLADALRRSSQNVVSIVLRWHRHDAEAASEAAKAYLRGDLSVTDLDLHYEATRTEAHAKRVDLQGHGYESAVRARIATVAAWTKTVQPTSSPLPGFDLHYAAPRHTPLCAMILPASEESDGLTFDERTEAIARMAQLDARIVVIGPEGAQIDRINEWIKESRTPRCRIERLNKRIVEVWA